MLEICIFKAFRAVTLTPFIKSWSGSQTLHCSETFNISDLPAHLYIEPN